MQLPYLQRSNPRVRDSASSVFSTSIPAARRVSLSAHFAAPLLSQILQIRILFSAASPQLHPDSVNPALALGSGITTSLSRSSPTAAPLPTRSGGDHSTSAVVPDVVHARLGLGRLRGSCMETWGHGGSLASARDL